MQAPTPATTEQQWLKIKTGLRSSILVSPPSSNDTKSSAPACMVLIMPGAFMEPKNYMPLAQAIVKASQEFEDVNIFAGIASAQPAPITALLNELDQAEIAAAAAAAKDKGASTPARPPDALTRMADMVDLPLPTSRNITFAVLAEAVQACVAQGFKLQVSPAGRYTNVVVASHSFAGCLFNDVAFQRTGGTILLQSCWSTLYGTDKVPMGWAASSRPIMVLGGQMDGQMPWSAYLAEASVSAWTATRQGREYAATYKPVILVPGLNHGQICNQKPMVSRGDCYPTLPADKTINHTGRIIAAFMTTHFFNHTPIGEALHARAVQYLIKQAEQTAQLMDVYASAIGIGSLMATWQAAKVKEEGSVGIEGQHPSQSHTSGRLVTRPVLHGKNVGFPLSSGEVCGIPAGLGAFERLGWCSALGHGVGALNPGTVEQAEEEAAELQMYVARRAVSDGLLPPSALDKLHVVVHVHTNLTSFLYTQPVIRSTGQSRIELQIHALIHWPLLDRAQGFAEPVPSFCFAHTLWLKLRDGAALAAHMRPLLGLPPLTGNEYKHATPVTARDLNELTMRWAMDNVAPEHAERYMQTGAKLVFSPDAPTMNPAQWVMKSRMVFKPSPVAGEHPTSGNNGTSASTARVEVQVISAVHWASVVMPNKPLDEPVAPPADEESSRFWMPLYVKVMSRAQAVEWIQLGSVRQATLPESFGCRWGGNTLP